MFIKTSFVRILFLVVTVFPAASAQASLTSQPAITLWAGNIQEMDVPLLSLNSNGSDGALSLSGKQILTGSSDWVFNFSSIYIPAGTTLDFFRDGYQGVIYLLGSEDIVIDGLLREVYGPLVISTIGGIAINGTVQSPLLAISANEIYIKGVIDTSSAPAVPLPAAFWLFGTGLSALLLGRNSIRKNAATA